MIGQPARQRALAGLPYPWSAATTKGPARPPQASLAQVNPDSLNGIASYFEEMSP